MTTAARPTFNTARGGAQKGESDLGKLSKQYSSRDLPGHTKLKYREPGQVLYTNNYITCIGSTYQIVKKTYRSKSG